MSNQLRNLQMSRARRVHRVRARVIGTVDRPRLAVSRTLQHISAQIIDDFGGYEEGEEAGGDCRGSWQAPCGTRGGKEGD
jgi:hypothetical protein